MMAVPGPGWKPEEDDHEDEYLKHCLVKYKNKDYTRREVHAVFISYGDLKPVVQEQVFNDGTKRSLLSLKGCIPVHYKGGEYNIPICICLMETHPFRPPLCHVQPTAYMEINPGKHVDRDGRVYLPYLHEWKHGKSDLIGLIEVMRTVFGEEPPMFYMQSWSNLHDLSHNALTSIPEMVFFMTDLQHLNLSDNKLTRISEAIGNLTNLKMLIANHNMLTSLPQAVCSLPKLEVLRVTYNKLSTLPRGIEKMEKLKSLVINCNELTEIPTALCSLPALEMLIINNNHIAKLPINLSRARRLKCLDVRENPLTYPPQKVCVEGFNVIMTFLKEESVKEKRMLQAFNRLSLKVTQAQLKPLTRSLGLDKEEIDAVKTSAPDDLPDQVYLTLEKWREKEGDTATLPELEQHLRYLDFHQLADGLLGTPMSPDGRNFESIDQERGPFYGTAFEQATQQQSSTYPSVTVDDNFPIIKYERLHFPKKSFLGQGGFAAVSKAHHQDWKHDVAVKCLLSRQIEGSEQQVLYSEARKLNLGSRSTCIISLLGVCLEPHFAIVMPYMENGSLAELLKDVDVPWSLRSRMAHEISLGMTFLHCQDPQILHCDLKAENVLLDDDFHVKISDFGLSKWRTESRIVTGTSPTGATITHAPPEYIVDINHVPTSKFDVYSFGVLLWEIITRRKPYENAMNSALIELGVRTGQRPDMRLVPTDVPDMDTVSQLMERCWSQNPDDRPPFQECEGQLRGVKNKFSKENILEAIIYVQKEKLGKK